MSSVESSDFYIGQRVQLLLRNDKRLKRIFKEEDVIEVEITRIFFEEPLFEVFIEHPDGVKFFRKEVFSQDLLPLEEDDVGGDVVSG